MRIVPNTGTDRIVDLARSALARGSRLDLMSPSFSLFAFAELREQLRSIDAARMILPADHAGLDLLGGPADRAARNRLQTRWLAAEASDWVEGKSTVRCPPDNVPQSAVVVRDAAAYPSVSVLGSFAFTTDGFGMTPGHPMRVIQASETAAEAAQIAAWFDAMWEDLPDNTASRTQLVATLRQLAAHRAPAEIYAQILKQMLGGDAALGED